MSRGADGTVTPINRKRPDPTMQCIVVGGVANGVLIPSMRRDADIIELGRPTHAKPLTHKDADIEFAKETDVYEINIIYFPGKPGADVIPFGLAIVQGQTPAWAMTQLVKAFVIHAVDELKKETIQT